MSNRTRRALRGGALALLATAAVLAACIVSLGDGPRRIVAGDIVSEVIVPTYDEVVVRTDTLSTTTAAFAASPTLDTLATMRTAWRAAREPWKRTDAFRFGPLTLQSLAAYVDQFPVDPPRIETELAGTAPIDAAYFATLGANKKGFHSIEWLIFGDDATILAAFTTDAGADRRRPYVAGAAADLTLNARKLRDAWVEYAGKLAAPGAGNTDFPSVRASIDALVNECVFQAEVVADARLGKPKGAASGGTPQPSLQESEPSDTSVDDMVRSLESIRLVYLGGTTQVEGKGISSLIRAQSPVVDLAVRNALENALGAVRAIPRPYTQALLDKAPEVEAAYIAVQELQSLFATEVIATLGATLKFNDNDGD